MSITLDQFRTISNLEAFKANAQVPEALKWLIEHIGF